MNQRRWDDAFLDEMRETGDPEADAVIAEVVAGRGIERVNELMRSLVRNDDIVPEEMPAIVRAYLESVERFPAWADKEAIERGETFFATHWPVIVTLLFCASLPSAYAAHKGAQVLRLTQRMTKHVDRRIFETAQFVVDVMALGGLSKEGRGVRSAEKVRLMHSAIRHIIEHNEAWRSRWDTGWGTPINQEDLAGTLMTFSLQVVLGMKRFGIRILQEDEEAYLHCWKVVGHMMGVDERLIPADMAEAETLARTIFERQKGASQAGTELTSALLAFMTSKMPPFFSGAPAALVRQSIDADVADLLGVPRAQVTGLLLKAEKWLFDLMSRSDSNRHSRLMPWLSEKMVQELVKIERGGNRDLFRIPPSLRAEI